MRRFIGRRGFGGRGGLGGCGRIDGGVAGGGPGCRLHRPLLVEGSGRVIRRVETMLLKVEGYGSLALAHCCIRSSNLLSGLALLYDSPLRKGHTRLSGGVLDLLALDCLLHSFAFVLCIRDFPALLLKLLLLNVLFSCIDYNTTLVKIWLFLGGGTYSTGCRGFETISFQRRSAGVTPYNCGIRESRACAPQFLLVSAP